MRIFFFMYELLISKSYYIWCESEQAEKLKSREMKEGGMKND